MRGGGVVERMESLDRTSTYSAPSPQTKKSIVSDFPGFEVTIILQITRSIQLRWRAKRSLTPELSAPPSSWDFLYLAFIVRTLDLITAFHLMQGGELKIDALRWTTASALCLAHEADEALV